MESTSNDALSGSRKELRQRLIEERGRFVAGPDHAAAEAALARHLSAVLQRLEPACLGLYWPMRGEFKAPAAIAADAALAGVPLALPYTRRTPREMVFRRWDGKPPALLDESKIPSSDGESVVPDVIVAPCVGFEPDGSYRLGYGGGYFDRYMAAHPHVTAVGVAWSIGRLAPGRYVPEPHDKPMALIVCENGVI
ncbi:MAG: 5-formyltetrahydrofolate cyclo-ligase [Proteobacteria bacterium]|nr:5-formyltetrahydrofolate cyclo-ligase [Pseudomonadota bacterium]